MQTITTNDSIIVTGSLRKLRDPASPLTPTHIIHKPARLALMLAFAHQLQRDIDSGRFASRADAAKRMARTPARLTQILALTLLAPNIQEQILFLERIDGVEPLSERVLRPIFRCME